MSRFPKAEPDIAALALLVVEGFANAPEYFPNPPVPTADLKIKLEGYQAAAVATAEAERIARERHTDKDEKLEDLADSLRVDLKYAEYAAGEDTEKLAQLGWSPRREGTPLQPPGEVREIELVEEGATWVVIRWKAPLNGGPVAAYRLERKQDAGPWHDAGITMNTQERFSDLPRGVELNFRVCAQNRAGIGQPSATITVVL